MTKSTITRERLEEIVSDPMINQGSEFAMMARMALAALDSEPVAEVCEDYAIRYISNGPAPKEGLRPGDKLYRHAQPAPEAMPECFRNAVSALESLYRNGQKQCWHERYTADMAYASGVLNACRAAMLQTMSLTGNSPVITDEGGATIIDVKYPFLRACSSICLVL